MKGFPRPGNCPACGVFVSVRAKHAYRCNPVLPVRDVIRWTSQSPMMAWPRTHVRRHDGVEWASSPVAGIGPRLLVLLARHQSAARRDLPAGKKARYGPSHALKDLLALTPQLVVDAVLNPLPAWVPCSGTWHRIWLRDGELAAGDHGQIDLMAERTASAITGEPLSGCVAAVADWAGRSSAVRLPWIDTLACFDVAAQWGVDAVGHRDAWITARVAPSFVVPGIPENALLPWVTWTRDRSAIAAWHAVGWTSREAHGLSAMGLTPEQSGQWRRAGLGVGLIGEAYGWELSPAEVGRWWVAGFPPAIAGQLAALEVDVDAAMELKRKLGSAQDVLARELPF